jgi:class 3 adenylate cyclase
MVNDERPTGTVTFLFTDIEGSTKLWQQHPDAMAQALPRHDAIIKTAVAKHSGIVFSTGGDGFAAVFTRAGDALASAVELQRALAIEAWPGSTRLSVRVGLHTGEAIERDGDYFGPSVNRAARLMSAGHGGQTLCSETTHGVLLGQVPLDVQLDDLGRVRLKGFATPERVFGVVASGLQPKFPPLVDQEGDVGSRPAAPDLVIGRSQELDEIVDLLTSRRVVTLTGTGGVGKTTLALAAIDRVAEKFPDGVWWIDLAAVDANDDILPVIAGVVRVRDHLGEGFTSALATALSDQRMLLVLDNCEHVLGAATAIVGHLVARCPGLVVLSTSRVRLGVPSERDLVIRPLRVEGERSAALELLIERVGRAGVGVDPDELAALEDITRRLDGLPLALELAAARCRTMSPIAVAERLRDRIRLPAARGAAVGSRATLDGTVQWGPMTCSPRSSKGCWPGYPSLSARSRSTPLSTLPVPMRISTNSMPTMPSPRWWSTR